MTSADVQSRLADGQDDGNSGLDDAVWDALQDSDEVRLSAHTRTCHMGPSHYLQATARAAAAT
jgi:hypothetical protein